MNEEYHEHPPSVQPSLFDALEKPWKTCRKCHQNKPIDEFNLSKSCVDGHEHMCKTCRRAYTVWHHKTKRENPTFFERKPYVLPDTRVCTRCQKEFPLTSENFRQGKSNKGGFTTWCKQCDSDWHKQHYAKPEIKAAFKEREAREEAREKKRERYQQNVADPAYRERIRAYGAKRWARIKDSERVRKRLKYAADPQYARQILDRTRAWELAHPAETRQMRMRKSARRGSDAPTVVEMRQIIERDGYVCHICGQGIDPKLRKNNPAALTFDHVVPLIPPPGEPKGEHVIANLKPSHNCCNGRKGNRRMEDLTAFDRRGPDR